MQPFQEPAGNIARSIGEIDPLPLLPECVTIDQTVPVLKTAAGIAFVRTPDERFQELKGFPFQPHYFEVDGLRLAYVDEGPRDAPVVLLLHGQPDWSYLYRKMIPPIVAVGYRVIALDLMGFGRSDKPINQAIHTYEQHVAWVKAFINGLGLSGITAFVQDWGGLIGLRVIGDEPERFARVVSANTILPLFEAGKNPYVLPADVGIDCNATSLSAAVAPAMARGLVPRFNAWIRYTLTSPTFTPAEVMGNQVEGLDEQELAAYDAPFPSFIYRAAPRTFPSMIVAVTDNSAAAWAALGQFEKPFLALAGERDPNLGRKELQDALIAHIPGAAGQPHARYDAGHFIQDELGDEMAAVVITFIQDNP